MSIELMSKIWKCGPPETGARFVLLALADHANDDGVCYPSAARIAEKCCMSVRGVRRLVKQLADGGWITVDGNAGPRGCNVFTIHSEPLTQCHPDTVSPLTQTTAPPDTVSPEPSKNHHNPPSPAGKTPPRGSRLPEDWKPGEQQIAYAIAQGIPENDIDHVAASFADYWISKAGKDARKTDWNRVWQRWVREDATRRPGRRSPGSGVGAGPRRSGGEVARDAADSYVAGRLQGSR